MIEKNGEEIASTGPSENGTTWANTLKGLAAWSEACSVFASPGKESKFWRSLANFFDKASNISKKS